MLTLPGEVDLIIFNNHIILIIQNALAQKQMQKEVEESMIKDEENRKTAKDIQERLLSEEELRKEEIKEREQTIHRLELGQLLLEQRNREWEAVLARDHELLLMMKHDRDNEINFEQSLWQVTFRIHEIEYIFCHKYQ